MKILKWTAILVGGVFVILVVIGMLLPKEYVERAHEERLQREAERARLKSAAAAEPAPARTVSPSSRNSSPTLSGAQRNAIRSANAYLKLSGFSRQGLIGQLSSDYGEKFSVEDATAAVDSMSVDWDAQAARSAASYLKLSGFSCRGLIDQLSSEHGEKYTAEQATHGATQAGIC